MDDGFVHVEDAGWRKAHDVALLTASRFGKAVNVDCLVAE